MSNYITTTSLKSMTLEDKVMFFERTLLATKRRGIDNVLSNIRKTDFYIAPSSANKHGNYQSGLVDHSLLVHSLCMRERDIILDMKPELANDLKEESVTISTLLHDVCKIAFYKQEQKWKKGPTGNWVSYQGYSIEDRFPIGHGEKSVIMLQQWGLEMTPEEMIAIRFHMGAWEGKDDYSYRNSVDMVPLLSLVMSADLKSSLLLEDQIER